jgi:glutamate 5-kinase
MRRLGWETKPTALYEVQVAAAVGQSSLIRCYEEMFAHHGVVTAQVLLTHADFQNRQRYLNACATFRSMMELKVLPVVNENDTVAVDEIRFGDNDSLAAMVANLVDANLLVLLTDQEGLYDDNPSTNSDAKFISQAESNAPELKSYAGDVGGKFGTGGMATKVKAAVIASKTGASTIIANGRTENILLKLLSGSEVGTLLLGESDRITSKKQWLASQLHVKGELILDSGAAKMLIDSGKSLLPVGVKQVIGSFERGELVSCCTDNGEELARGLVNYSSNDARLIAGKQTKQISETLGAINDKELIHRDNLVLV